MSHMRPEHRMLLLTMIPRPNDDVTKEIRRLVGMGVNWEYTVNASDRLATGPLLSAALDEAGVSLPPEIERHCREVRVAGVAHALLVERRLLELCGALEEAGISCMVLKGLPLAHELYGDSGLRPGSDLDILVHRGDRNRALSVLGRLGFRLPAGSFSMRFFRAHHFHALLVRRGDERIPIELHWDTQPFFSRSRIPEEEFWKRRRSVAIGGRRLGVPGREENFLYLVQHLARHSLGLDARLMADPAGALLDPVIRGRLTWLSDLVLLARSRSALDWRRTARLAERWGLEAELQAALAIIRSLDPLPHQVTDEATTIRPYPVARYFPGLARTSPCLHLRPILIFEGLRHAFPGARWIRWRYGVTGPGVVASRMVLHASVVLLELGRMLLSAMWETAGSMVRRARAVDPREREITHLGREIYPREPLQ